MYSCAFDTFQNFFLEILDGLSAPQMLGR